MPNERKALQFYRGPGGSIPSLAEAEPGWASDEKHLYIGNADGTNTKIPSEEDLQQLNQSKQDKVTGTKGQIVGFDEEGNMVPQDSGGGGANQVIMEGGAEILPGETFGAGPFKIYFDEGDDSSPTPTPSSAKMVVVSLPQSGWAEFSQTIEVQGVLADETLQLITPTPSFESMQAYYEAQILVTAQSENGLTFTCTQTPTTDLTVYIVIMEVSSG